MTMLSEKFQMLGVCSHYPNKGSGQLTSHEVRVLRRLGSQVQEFHTTIVGGTQDEAQAKALEQAKAYLDVETVDNRFFVGTLTTTGDHFLIPSSRRMDWHAFDAAAKQSCEPGPIPDYAVKISELEHLEFENPKEVM